MLPWDDLARPWRCAWGKCTIREGVITCKEPAARQALSLSVPFLRRQASQPPPKPAVRSASGRFVYCVLQYKFFGPHAGILYGRYDLLNELFAYKVRPAPDSLPGRFETGTQNHEGLAGVLGAVEYFDWLGQTFGQNYQEKYAERFSGRRLHLKQALAAVRAYEFEISRAVLAALGEVPGLRLYRLDDPRRGGEDGRPEHQPVGRQLLRHQRHRAVGAGGEWRHGARRPGALQHAGGGTAPQGGAEGVGLAAAAPDAIYSRTFFPIFLSPVFPWETIASAMLAKDQAVVVCMRVVHHEQEGEGNVEVMMFDKQFCP